MLKGFGESDEKGLWAIIDDQIFGNPADPTSPYFGNPTKPAFPSLVSEIIKGLRATNIDRLVPFGLHNSANHSGDLSLFLFAASDLLFSTLFGVDTDYATLTLNGANLSPAQRGHLNTSLGHILDSIRTRLSSSTIGTTVINNNHVNDLRAAITGLSFFELQAPNPIFNSLVAFILQHLRSNNATAVFLTPFGLGTNAPPSGSFLEKFMLACSDKLFFTLAPAAVTMGANALSPTQSASLTVSLDRMINHFQGKLVGSTIGTTPITLNHATDLKNAIAGITMANLATLGLTSLGGKGFGNFGGSNFQTTGGQDPLRLLGEANAAITRAPTTFRQKQTAVKARLNKNSWVDIRGCRIGQVQSYLQALQAFFGRTNNLPSVTGPEWFQSFPFAGWEPLATEANVDALWVGGNAGRNHTEAEIQTAYAKAARYAGIDTHITFWAAVSALDDFQFAALLWRGSLPPLPIQANRLENFDTLDLSDTMGRAATIFDITASLPSNATFTRIENRHPQMVALQSEINTIAGLGTPPVATELNQSFTRLQQINNQLGLTVVPAAAPSPLQAAHLTTYTTRLKKYFEIVTIPNGPANLFNVYLQVEELAVQANPPAADLNARQNDLRAIQGNIGAAGIVPAPANAPNPPSAATLQGYITQLIAHLNSNADFVTFKTALRAKTQQQATPQHAPAAFRYYFFVGLALLMDEVDNYYFYTLNAPRDEAMRSFMRTHWQGVLPAGNRIAATNHNSTAARRVSLSSSARVGGNIGINPYEEYADHLVTETGTP